MQVEGDLIDRVQPPEGLLQIPYTQHHGCLENRFTVLGIA